MSYSQVKIIYVIQGDTNPATGVKGSLSGFYELNAKTYEESSDIKRRTLNSNLDVARHDYVVQVFLIEDYELSRVGVDPSSSHFFIYNDLVHEIQKIEKKLVDNRLTYAFTTINSDKPMTVHSEGQNIDLALSMSVEVS